jgi:hypothetical protein
VTRHRPSVVPAAYASVGSLTAVTGISTTTVNATRSGSSPGVKTSMALRSAVGDTALESTQQGIQAQVP